MKRFITVKYKNLIGFLLFSFVSMGGAIAQTSYNLYGVVTDDTGRPVVGASIFIDGTTSGTVSDFDGNYLINASLDQGQYTIVVSSVGYTTNRFTIELGLDDQVQTDVTLQQDILGLDEVVIIGSTEGVNKRTLGNAVSTVRSEALINNAATAVDQALSGKIPGALVQQNSGDPAGGISIRLRGPSTIQGSSDPLYIVDGVIYSNASYALIDVGGYSQNRLVDLNPNDIERIEVVKGAAAAAIYGARASNGVIQIFTKKGQSGDPRISFTTNLKVNELRKQIDYNKEPIRFTSFSATDLNTEPVERYNYQDFIFETAYGIENFLSVSGGANQTRYYISGSYLDNGGIIKNTNFQRYGLKLSIQQQFGEWLDANIGLSYNSSNSKDIPNGGIAAAYGALTGFLFSENSVDPRPDESGVYPRTSLLVARTNPLEAVDRFDFQQKTNRVVGSLGLNTKLGQGLTANYLFGIDYFGQIATAFIPKNNTSTQADGFGRRSDNTNFQYNSDLNFVYRTDLTPSIKSTTTLGGSWQYWERYRIGINAENPPILVQVVGDFREPSLGETRAKISYWGSFLQQSFNISDKLYLNGALRLDGASSFGEDNRNQIFSKASISYVLSEEEFFKNLFGNGDFKLRASWGEAGNLTAIGPYSRFTTFNPSSHNGATSLLAATNKGNEEIAPERQTEIEVGFDLGLLNNRVGIEFTLYDQEVNDLLLSTILAPSTGFSSAVGNVGKLTNSGIELLLRASPIWNKKVQWNITATYSSNKNEVTDIAGSERIGLSNSFATSYVIEGEPLGVFYRASYERDDSGAIVNTGTYPYFKNGGNAIIGDPNPEWFGSLINEVTVGDFSFRVQFDAVQGQDVFNWNRRLLNNLLFGGGPGVGSELRGDLPKRTGGGQAGIFEEFVEDGSFIKLRELAITYNLRKPIKGVDNLQLSLVGRNLISWDDYQAWDPEINTTGQNNGVRGFDFAGVPIPRTIQLGINFTL